MRKETCNCKSELSISLDVRHGGQGVGTNCKGMVPRPGPGLCRQIFLSIPPKNLAFVGNTGTGKDGELTIIGALRGRQGPYYYHSA